MKLSDKHTIECINELKQHLTAYGINGIRANYYFDVLINRLTEQDERIKELEGVIDGIQDGMSE